MKAISRECLLVAVFAAPVVLASSSQGDGAALDAAVHRYPNFTNAQRLSIYRAEQTRTHPHQRDLSWSEQFAQAYRFLRRRFQASPATVASPANFQGNLTVITDSSSESIVLQRQSDCSLTFYNGNLVRTGNPTFQSLASTTNYQNLLHAEAGLSTQAGVFAKGCADPTIGLSSRRAAYQGQTAQGLSLVADTGYDVTTGNNALFYGTFNPNTRSVYDISSDSTMPNIESIATGDLNGDGLADIVGLNATSAAISVWLASKNGSLSVPTVYSLPGNTTEAAVIADVNGDGIVDVVVATQGTGGQETISVLTGTGSGTLNAGQSFPVTTPTGANLSTPYPIANLIAADLRGSGAMDIVGSNGIVLLNNGNGSFTQSTAAFSPVLATSDYGPNLAAGDFNNDGKLDLAVDNGKTVCIYLGTGSGTFTAGKCYLSNAQVGYLSATDLDGDGNVDLYIGLGNGGLFVGDQFDSTQAYALMGNGDGTFRGAPSLPFVYTGSNVADLNGDKVPDAVGVNEDGSLTIYLGDGKGNFNAAATLATSPVTIGGTQFTVGGIDSLSIADVNGDGIPDLAFIATGFNGPGGTPGVFIALGTGQGGFAAPSFYAVPSTLASGDIDIAWTISNLHLADLNGDGKADLIYNFADTSSHANTIYFGNVVQLGNGDGTFRAPQVILYRSIPYAQYAPTETSYVQSVTDLNGDGIPDLVLLSQTPSIDPTLSSYVSVIQVALGKGDGSFSAPTTITGPDIMVQSFTDVIPASIAVADMNGDGIPDIVAVGSSSAYNLQVAIALGKGDGSFQTPVLTSTAGQYLNNDQQLAIADFNGDGKPDVIITDPFIPGSSGIYLGNGDGTLQASGGSSATLPLLAVYLPVGGATLALDLNGDGKPDVISGNSELLSQAPLTNLPSFALALSSVSGTVTAGKSATTTVTLAPSNGFNQSVALSCTGLPAGASCSFAPASVALNASAATSILTITTTASAVTLAAGANPAIPPNAGGWLLLALALPMYLLRRRAPAAVRRNLVATLALFLGAVVVTACGGGGGSGGGGGGSGGGGGGGGGSSTGTPSGSYTVSVAASAGTSTQAANYTLTVN